MKESKRPGDAQIGTSKRGSSKGKPKAIALLLALPTLPKPHTGLTKRSRDFKKALLSTAAEMSGGTTTIAQVARATTATAALRQAERIERILAAAGEPGTFATATGEQGGASATSQTGLTHEQWLAYSDRLIRYREAADRAIAALGLDSRAEKPSVWDTIYTMPPQLPEAAPSPPDVAGQDDGHLASLDAPEGHGASANGIPEEGGQDGPLPADGV